MTYEILVTEFGLLEDLGYFEQKITKDKDIFRCRYNKNNKSFTKVSKISYPSACKVKDYSRVNRPKQKLFYASDSRAACLAEMIPIWNKQIFYHKRNYLSTIGKWKITKDLILILIPDFQSTSPYNINFIRRYHFNKNQRTFWEYISNKFKTDTLDDEHIYSFTSAFACVLRNFVEKQYPKVDGFMYSNVKDEKFVNIAIDPHLVDTKSIIPISAEEISVRITDFNSNGMPNYYENGVRKKGTIQGSQIKWNY